MEKELFKGLITRRPHQGTVSDPVVADVTVTADVFVPVIDMAAYVGKTSGGDFTTAYAGANTITLGTLPDLSALTAEDILTVVQFNAAGTVVATYRREDAAMSISTGVLTVPGATFAGTDTFVIYTNVQKPITIDTSAIASEVTLAAILADTATIDTNIASLAAVDFATETTLAAVLADTATMDASLASLAAEDFATETTLAAADAHLVTLLGYTDNIETLLTAIDGHVDGLEASMTTMVTAVHAVDSVAGATDGGFAALVKRKDALAPLTPADGDYTYLLVNNQGSLWVQVSGPVSLNATIVDDAAFTPATSSVLPIGFMVDETGTDSVDEGDIGAPRMTADRKIYVANIYSDDTVVNVGDKFGLIGAVADETGADSVDEGDGGYLRMTLTRFLKTSMGDLLAGEDQTNGLFQIAKKPIAASTYAYSKDVSSALEASSISKATPGNLFRAFGAISATAPSGMYYVQILDSATLPADGAVTHLISPIPVTHVSGYESSFDTDEIEAGVAGASGIVIVLSTTLVTKTIASSYLFATVLYK